ncbi:uncharacterized protein BO80DRAFT_137564 [Aspergillus ibericus CBS 121593]|uniref:Uncharacterized protein n=1 Tax=Aspergillus ibericus CBS 121593 TaxID=1448316 RepID=A0A395HDE3_9EURO|nr:hypothetical protein BO80DRAFT_137564 [Aspergillus ibericus CBS 121593]RAL05483.1 hypothetical protein BO80DRAFT_137564 [Aspergillus ibericus CBS 121593]
MPGPVMGTGGTYFSCRSFLGPPPAIPSHGMIFRTLSTASSAPLLAAADNSLRLTAPRRDARSALETRCPPGMSVHVGETGGRQAIREPGGFIRPASWTTHWQGVGRQMNLTSPVGRTGFVDLVSPLKSSASDSCSSLLRRLGSHRLGPRGGTDYGGSL